MSLCPWWLQYRKLQVMFKVFPASLQTFIDTPNCVLEDRVQCTNNVIMVSDWNCLKYFCVFLYCNHQVHRDFLITLYNSQYMDYLQGGRHEVRKPARQKLVSFLQTSIPALGSTQPPIQWVPGGKAATAWSSSFTSIQRRGKEYVELYYYPLHTPSYRGKE
jgi:hypothetical protein